MKYSELTLATINNGAAEELFQRELKEIYKNINDPNTDKSAKRTIVVEITFRPGKRDRDMGGISIGTKTKLAPILAQESTFVVDRDGEKILEPDMYQPELTFPKDGKDNVVDYRARAAGERDDD